MRTGMRCAFAFMFLVMIAGAASVSSAADQSYVRLSGVFVLPATSELGVNGVHDGKVDTDSTVGVVGASGVWFDNGMEVEFEVGYRSLSLGRVNSRVLGSGTFTNSDISTVTYMGNIRQVFRPQDQFHPYVGAGLGVASHTLSFGRTKFDDTVFAYQAMVGLGYTVSKQMEMQAGFRFMGTTIAQAENTSFEYTYQTYGFDFGATYRF